MIPITERFLSECGGWKALQEARRLHVAGRVLVATYAPPLLEGRVREGSSELRSGLRILSPSNVENLCVCRASKRDGLICAHALAVGLEWIKPTPVSRPTDGFSKETGGESPTSAPSQPVRPQFATDQGLPLSLHVVLPPNFSTAWERDALTIGFEAVTSARRFLLSALDLTACYRIGPEDFPPIEFLLKFGEGVLPGIATLRRGDFLDLLPTLREHPRLTFAKSRPVTVHAKPFFSASSLLSKPELPAEALLLASANSIWILHDGGFYPMPVVTPATESPQVDLLVPRFALDLEGSLNHLASRLFALYGEDRFSVEEPQNRLSQPRGLHRNYPMERVALERLRSAGFTGPDRNGELVLKGESSTLPFFATLLPRLEKEWTVTSGTRFAHVTREIQRIEPRLEIRTSGENWFELKYELATSSGERFSSSEIQRLLQSGQTSIRGKNRQLSVFDPAMLEEFREALTDCDPQQTQLGLYRIARRHAPYLQQITEGHEGQIQSDPTWNEWTTSSLQPSDTASLGSMESILRPYQKEGVGWLNQIFRNGRHGLLADEMGLGKTVQTLAFISGLPGKSIVVCPSSLVFNWERESARFTPHLRTLAIHGSNRHALFGEPIRNADLIVTSYALLRRDLDQYQGIHFAAIVLDEAQQIKNPDSQNAQSAFALKGERRLALTGTPVENSLADLWSLMHFLMPGYLGSRQDFRERFLKPIENAPNGPEQRRLTQRIKPCILRRLKRNVLTELPDKIEQVVYCDLTPQQKDVYAELVKSTQRQVSEWAAAKDQGKARMLMLTALLRLRQASCDLRLLNLSGIDEIPEPSGKLLLLEELLNEVIDGGHRVLIFSQFTSMLRILRDRLTGLQIPHGYLDGQTKDRASQVDRFQSGQAAVFLISLKAGGTGLNLTAADTVIHFDPWWNPAVESQATDRAHRIGQKKVVNAYKLIARETVEEKILALQARKRAVIDATLDQEQPMMEGLGRDEILELLE